MTSWQRFLHSRHAVWLTHGSLLALSALYVWILLVLPFWLALLPGVFVGHRIGILLHEYLHGIPFRRYRHNLQVFTLWDGALLLFGGFEIFRASHLAHHRHLNTPEEELIPRNAPDASVGGFWRELEVVKHFVYLADALRGRLAFVRPSRMLAGFAISVGCIALWCALGRADVVGKMLAVNLITLLVPVSLRAAVEHHSDPDDPASTNEYRVTLPLFNLNRHVHHHEAPRCPWYRLQWRTARPLPASSYVTHWWRLRVRRELVRMAAPEAGGKRRVESGEVVQ